MAEFQHPLLSLESEFSHHESIQSCTTSETLSKKPSFAEALNFIRSVKHTFRDDVPKYTKFVKVLYDYRETRTDLRGVMSRVQVIFKDHPELVSGLNYFMPVGYQISLPTRGMKLVKKVKVASLVPSKSSSGRRVRETKRNKGFAIAIMELDFWVPFSLALFLLFIVLGSKD